MISAEKIVFKGNKLDDLRSCAGFIKRNHCKNMDMSRILQLIHEWSTEYNYSEMAIKNVFDPNGTETYVLLLEEKEEVKAETPSLLLGIDTSTITGYQYVVTPMTEVSAESEIFFRRDYSEITLAGIAAALNTNALSKTIKDYITFIVKLHYRDYMHLTGFCIVRQPIYGLKTPEVLTN